MKIRNKTVAKYIDFLLLGNTKLHGKVTFLRVKEDKPVAIGTKLVYFTIRL